VHHLLGLWALGASPEEIENLYQYNIRYQIPIEKPKRQFAESPDLRDAEAFSKCLGSDDYYSDFMRFFEDEIDRKGVPAVLREYLFKGDERANDIFYRMYAGN
jgi:oxidoreductase AflY